MNSISTIVCETSQCAGGEMDSANNRLLVTLTLLAAVLVGAALCAISAPSFAGEIQAKKTTKQTVKAKPFTSPEQAMQELAAAMKARDRASLKAMLGAEGEAILNSGDPLVDKAAGERFLAAYDESHKIEPRGIAKAWILVGKDDWPLPIPLVKRGSAWYFDARAGKEELLNRRIGRNELAVQQAVLAYVDAQREYYSRNPMNDKLLQYAQRFISSPDKRDGLYYPTKAGEKPSPLGPLFDARRAAGIVQDDGSKPAPYHGYYYKILKGQGPAAPGGAYDYVVNGKMIGGFALVAYPATYGNSGIVTFLVSHDGAVYEKNLGADTAAIAQKMTRFNPDKSWKRL